MWPTHYARHVFKVYKYFYISKYAKFENLLDGSHLGCEAYVSREWCSVDG